MHCAEYLRSATFVYDLLVLTVLWIATAGAPILLVPLIEK
jgi:hypothetical protein